MLMQAMEAMKAEATAQALRDHQQAAEQPDVAKARVVTGEEGRKVADAVHFTGDPEWDEAMLEDIGPDAEDLDPEFVSEFLR